MKSLKEFKPLIRLLGKEKFRLVLASILIFINCLSEIFTGYLNGAAVESVTNLQLEKALIYLGIYFLLEITVDGFIIHKANSMLRKVESILTRRIGFETYKKALDLPAYAFEKTSSGEVINRITNDADTLSFTFEHLLNMFSSTLASILVLIYIFMNSWIIGLEIVILMLLLGIVIKIYTPKLKQIHKERKEEQDKFVSLTTESIRGIREIKTLGVKQNLINDMTDIIKLIYKKSEREIDIDKEFNIITRFIKAIMECGTFILCVFLVYYGKVSLTFFVAMTYYVYRYMWLIQNLTEFIRTYQRTTVSLGRVNEILENKLYEDEQFGEKKLDKVKGIIEFKNVSFGYPNEGNILKNFNLTIEPNKKIAIVGKSGQGKSTLFNLLTRVFDVNKGTILIDGIDIKDLSENELRKHVSIIRQEPFIFNRTIKENFLIVDKKSKLSNIRKYCSLAYIDDYIMTLPKKYNTLLGEGGVNLSGGQKQRLAIARTLSKKCEIVLFDEATSALDNESQEYVKRAINNLVKDHTVVIVAHRLSTIMDADIIYVVDKGKIVASGTHNELLNNNEAYKNLYLCESLNS